MELSNSNIKTFIKLSQEKSFLTLQEKKIPKKVFIFSQKKAFLRFLQTETPKRNFLIFQEELTKPKNENFLYFSKKVMNKIFQKHFRVIVSIFSMN